MRSAYKIKITPQGTKFRREEDQDRSTTYSRQLYMSSNKIPEPREFNRDNRTRGSDEEEEKCHTKQLSRKQDNNHGRV
jgi:hypothetical protein